MDDSGATPVLSYTIEPMFGWRQEAGDFVLILPPRPSREVAAESSGVLTASTGFLLLFGVVAYFVANRTPPDMTSLRVMLVIVGLMAIGQWVLVLIRVVSQLRTVSTAGMVRIGHDGLALSDALPPGPAHGHWTLGEILSVQMNVVRTLLGTVQRVRLTVATRVGTVSAYTFAWPAGVPVAPVNAKLDELLKRLRATALE